MGGMEGRKGALKVHMNQPVRRPSRGRGRGQGLCKVAAVDHLFWDEKTRVSYGVRVYVMYREQNTCSITRYRRLDRDGERHE